MFHCAFLIGESTKEDVWHRKKNSKDECSMYWIQPGGQIIGDQTFDAFSHTDSGNRLEKYMTSRRKISTENFEFQVWIAIGVTLSGFILQFTGLRGIHSSVSVAQLGVIMVMSMARAALRMQRLKPEDNCFATFPDQVIGHELDWLALSIGRGLIHQDVKGSRSGTPTTSDSEERNFWRFSGSADKDKRILKHPPPTGLEDVAAKLLAYRTRLAFITDSSTSSTTDATKFKDNMVEVRAQSRQLAALIEATMKAILSKAEIKPDWMSEMRGASNNSQSIFWGVRCVLGKDMKGISNKHIIHLELRRDHEAPGKPWILKNKLELEAVLGLWVWSLKSDPEIETHDPETGLIRSTASNVQSRRIFSRDQGSRRELEIWLGNDMNIITDRKYANHNQNAEIEDASALWKVMESPMATPNSKSHSATDSKPPLIRFFGGSEELLSHSHTAQENRFLSAAIEGSLVTACAQHIFSSFFASILEIVDTIGAVNIQEAETFRLENPLVTEIVELFTEMRLGTRQEALLCTIPSVIPHLEAPYSSKVLKAATKFASDRKGIDFKKAESVLRWAWGICTGPTHSCTAAPETDGNHDLAKQATILLGELYRWALVKDSSTTTNFAQSGISWLEGKRADKSVSTCQDTCDIIDRYVAVLKQIPDHEFTDSDLIPAMEKADLVKVLSFLTKPPKGLEGKTKGDALCKAAAYGWTEVVFALLELGAEPDFRDRTRKSPLSHAAEKGRVEVVKELLAWGAFPNFQDDINKTPLSYASMSGSDQIVDLLLRDPRVFPDQEDHYGQTPLILAVENGWEAVVKLLLHTGKVNADKKGKDELTPLFLATERGYEGIVVQLLKNDEVDPSAMNHLNRTSLSQASVRGDLSMIQCLLNSGRVSPDTQDGSGQTPLSQAAMNGHLDTVQYLIETWRVDPDQRTRYMSTPFSLAAEYGHLPIVKYLFETGQVDPGSKGLYQATPLHCAARDGHLDIVKWLIQTLRLAPDTITSSGTTPLAAAARKGHSHVVKYLFDTGLVDPDAKEKDGFTPLSQAAFQGNLDIVRCLLEDCQVDPNSKDGNGRTALWEASANNHFHIMQYLLDNWKIDPNIKDNRGRAPLSFAAEFGKSDIVQYLLQNCEVDPNIKDDRGMTPLSLATETFHLKIVQFLLQSDKVYPDAKFNSYETRPSHAKFFADAQLNKLLQQARRKENLNN